VSDITEGMGTKVGKKLMQRSRSVKNRPYQGPV